MLGIGEITSWAMSFSEGPTFMEVLKHQKCPNEKWLSELGSLSWRRKDLMGWGHDNSLNTWRFVFIQVEHKRFFVFFSRQKNYYQLGGNYGMDMRKKLNSNIIVIAVLTSPSVSDIIMSLWPQKDTQESSFFLLSVQ